MESWYWHRVTTHARLTGWFYRGCARGGKLWRRFTDGRNPCRPGTIGQYYLQGDIEGRVGDADQGPDGSIVMVVATDAPLRAEGLRRVARRGILGLARTGGTSSHGSGDYVIAFLTARAVRSWHRSQTDTERGHVLRMDRLSPIFEATIEATEEAIYNSLLQAVSLDGRGGNQFEALPLDRLLEVGAKYNRLYSPSVRP